MAQCFRAGGWGQVQPIFSLLAPSYQPGWALAAPLGLFFELSDDALLTMAPVFISL